MTLGRGGALLPGPRPFVFSAGGPEARAPRKAIAFSYSHTNSYGSVFEPIDSKTTPNYSKKREDSFLTAPRRGFLWTENLPNFL